MSAAAQSPAPPIVHLPSIEVAGRRSEEPPRVEMARQHSPKGATRPKGLTARRRLLAHRYLTVEDKP